MIASGTAKVMDPEIPKNSKVCCQTKKPLRSGETFYTALLEGNGSLERRDYSPEAWQKLSDRGDFLCFWKGILEAANDKKPKLAPNDILLELFDRLADEPDKQDIRYILTLLLIRRRIFRYEREGTRTSEKTETVRMDQELQVYAPRRETVYSVPLVDLSEERIREIQDYLAEVLYSVDQKQ